MENSKGLFMGSQEEMANAPRSGSPLEAEDYIIKLAKIDLIKKPRYVNGAWDYSKMDWVFQSICAVHSLKAGGVMKDVEDNAVDPLRKYIFRDVNPYSMGFMPDKVTPSFMRALVAFMEKQSVSGRIQYPKFILVNSKTKEIVEDGKLRSEFINAASSGQVFNGYQAIPDIRQYEGRYIGCAIEVDAKGRNKISKFSKLPESFGIPKPEAEAEAMKNFSEFYRKVLEKREEQGKPPVASSMDNEEAEEIQIEDVAI